MSLAVQRLFDLFELAGLSYGAEILGLAEVPLNKICKQLDPTWYLLTQEAINRDSLLRGPTKRKIKEKSQH